MIDASQDSSCRRRLFAAPLHRQFKIDASNTAALPEMVAVGIRRYDLEYVVTRVDQAETFFDGEDWGESVFFCFRAKNHPDIVSFSANNPDVTD